MSNLWIKSDVDLSRHPKTYRLAALLNVRKPEALGLLHELWYFTMKYAWRDGNLEKFGDEAIARGAEWHAETPFFMKALREAGWLDGYIVHDWLFWAGKIVTDRLYNESRRPTPSNDAERRSTPTEKSREEKTRVEKSREENGNGGRARFSKPTAEEITAYGRSIGFSLDGNHFCDYYESKGWKIGNSPMKDWKAAVRTWKKNGYTSPMPTVQPGRKYVEHRPREEDLPTPEEVRKLVAGLGKSIPK